MRKLLLAAGLCLALPISTLSANDTYYDSANNNEAANNWVYPQNLPAAVQEPNAPQAIKNRMPGVSGPTGSEQLVLSLHKISNNRVVEKIQIFGSEIRPNVSSANESWIFKVNGQAVNVPAKLFREIKRERNSFSHDHNSGGVKQLPPPQYRCRLGGPAEGYELHARYLDYDQNYILKSHQMRPIYSESSNCLFINTYQLGKARSNTAAAKVVAIMKTIKTMTGY